MWNVKFFNPINQEILKEEKHKTIKSIHENHPHIPLTTWRNLAIGRSKFYDKILKLEKIETPILIN